MQDEDAEIVRAVLRGSRDDFVRLWDRYSVEAQRWAFAVTGDFIDAEEVAQEALSEALDRLDCLREPASFGGWLRHIVRNRAVSWIRRRQRTTPFESLSMTSDGRSVTEAYSRYEIPQPDAVLERRQRQQELACALKKLSPQHAEVVRMFYFENQSQESIASRLGTTVPAIKGALFRARVQLKEELRRHG